MNAASDVEREEDRADALPDPGVRLPRGDREQADPGGEAEDAAAGGDEVG